MARDQQKQAATAVATDAGTGAQLGQEAQGLGSSITPFLTQEMEHPQGYSQQDQTAQLAQGLGSAGGATSGITGQANLEAARTGNASGYQAALGDAARDRMKANAGISEGIAAKNADLKQTQQQEGAEGLGSLYKADLSGQQQEQQNAIAGIGAGTTAGQSGWLQNTLGIMNTLRGKA